MIIYGECNTECLFSKVIFGQKAKHLQGKDRVVKRIMDENGVLGIIDLDPSKPTGKYLEQIRRIEPVFNEIDIILRKFKSSYLVEISPYFEEWLVNLSKKSNVSPKDFNLPENPKKLHELISIKGRFDKLEERIGGLLEVIISKNKEHFNKLKNYIK